MQKRKKLKLGNSDFKSVMEANAYFIDKSLFIEEVVETENEVLLLPRPRRFGKTLNLSMLRCFFDILEPENKKLFENLKIWGTEKKVIEKQGKYPVISLSFKDAKSNTWGQTLNHIKIELANTYNAHYYLLESDVLRKHEKSKFQKIINETGNDIDFEVSLKNLSGYLERYHKQKTVILIDEYDTPIQAGYKKFYDNSISFLRNLLSGAFKDNPHLYKGVLTGILRVSRESIFTGLNNVNVHSILDSHFSDKFGFVENEVKQIIRDFDIKTDFAEIQKWYNGYRFGNTDNIYNPWSILNYVTNYIDGFKTFWANTSSDSLIKEKIEKKDANLLRQDLLKLINKESVEKEIEENFVFSDMEKDKDLLWTLLLYSGYLTTRRKLSRKKHEIAIPNHEVKTVFQDIIVKWLKTEVKIARTLLDDTASCLVNNRIPEFEKGFQQIMGDTFSYFDTAQNPEYVFQAYVLGLLAIIGDDYIIKSNRESGEGRYDIMLIPHDKTKYGVVIEIKRIPVGTIHELPLRVNQKLQEAQKQINQNLYYKELVDNKIEKNRIIKLPIVFAGKTPYVQPVK